MKALPILFKANSSGTLQQWTIGTEGATIITEFGQVGGKIQRTEDTIKTGKNVGKVNATTPESQAEAEALSKWEKQKNKKGYVEDRARATMKDTDLQGEECMLAQPYGTLENGVFVPDQNHKIKFPCAVQPKFDGHRGRIRQDATLWSRGHKPITQVPHIPREIARLFGSVAAPKLDGELYNHELKEDFEKLSSIMRQQKEVHPDHKLAQYHVYDIDVPGMRYDDRRILLRDHLKESEFLKPVETHIAHNHEEVIGLYNDFVARGYEGAIIRNLDGLYEGKRSYGLQKLKGFKDQEFPILGINEGKGKLQGHAATFICVTDEGETFDVKLSGPTSFLKECWDNHALWEKRLMTVRFTGWTKKRKVPRGEVGIRIREDL